MSRVISLLGCSVVLIIRGAIPLAFNKVLVLAGAYVEVEETGSSSVDIFNNPSVELWLKSNLTFIISLLLLGAIIGFLWLFTSEKCPFCGRKLDKSYKTKEFYGRGGKTTIHRSFCRRCGYIEPDDWL